MNPLIPFIRECDQIQIREINKIKLNELDKELFDELLNIFMERPVGLFKDILKRIKENTSKQYTIHNIKK